MTRSRRSRVSNFTDPVHVRAATSRRRFGAESDAHRRPVPWLGRRAADAHRDARRQAPARRSSGWNMARLRRRAASWPGLCKTARRPRRRSRPRPAARISCDVSKRLTRDTASNARSSLRHPVELQRRRLCPPRDVRDRLERHAADRTITRKRRRHLRVHRADERRLRRSGGRGQGLLPARDQTHRRHHPRRSPPAEPAGNDRRGSTGPAFDHGSPPPPYSTSSQNAGVRRAVRRRRLVRLQRPVDAAAEEHAITDGVDGSAPPSRRSGC